jgi:protein-S-isoprenylcysteine O-methyltransferase Ste14
VVFLVLVLGVSVVAGSLLMVAACVVLLAVFGGLRYRARVIERDLEREPD